MERERAYKEVIKKSEMTANNIYDYKKLSYPRNNFLNCEIEEEKEELIFYYDVECLKPFSEIKRESITTQLAALNSAAKLSDLAIQYQFSLNPNNLYYDVNGQVLVKKRDIYEIGSTYLEETFVEEYKSLIGHVLQKKYQYDDFLKGGMHLIKKGDRLEKYFSASSVNEIRGLLNETFQSTIADIRKTKIQVNKNTYRNFKISIVLCTLLLIAAAGSTLYLSYKVLPEKESMLQADNAYLEANYVLVIDALKKFPPASLPIHQKFILALSYIKSENLNANQKENILATLTLHGDEKLMDYWIYIGRLNVSEAENIAMQQSNDELLLYAYLKEKSIVEMDETITGEEKSKSLSDLESKIKPLSEKYTKEEE